MELYRRVEEVLHYLWDPIGVSAVPEARNEYDSYLSTVFSLLTSGAGTEQMADYLESVATERMGFSMAPGSREHTRKVAAILQSWREYTRIA